MEQTVSVTDLAIDGSGFFLTRDDETGIDTTDEVFLTRSGSFRVNSDGFLINDYGLYLYGEPILDGILPNPPSLEELEPVNLSRISGIAKASTSVLFNANLQASQAVNPAIANYDATDTAFNLASGNFISDLQFSTDIYDTQGGLRTLTLSLLKSDIANQWYSELHVEPATDIETGADLIDGQVSTGLLVFDTDGQLDLAASTLSTTLNILGSDDTSVLGANDVRWAAATGIGAQPITIDFGNGGNRTGITQFDSESTLESTVVDGAIFGELAGVEVNRQGIVSARFSNGIIEEIYQVPVAVVNNPDGLAAVGGGAFQITDNSGFLSILAPGAVGSGEIVSFALEASNVDMATEFSNLIITQRAYSASSRIITTADEMLTEAVSMKR